MQSLPKDKEQQDSSRLREAALEAVKVLILYLGGNPDQEDLKDTPRRVLAFYDEFKAACEPQDFTWFQSDVSDLLVVKDVPLFSLCAHHILPYYGKAHVGYLPSGRLLGLSKVARIVRQQASRLTVQEELSRDIAKAVQEATASQDVAVVTEASHMCMAMRGIRAVGAQATASAMLGRFRSEPELRAEFLGIVRR